MPTGTPPVPPAPSESANPGPTGRQSCPCQPEWRVSLRVLTRAGPESTARVAGGLSIRPVRVAFDRRLKVLGPFLPGRLGVDMLRLVTPSRTPPPVITELRFTTSNSAGPALSVTSIFVPIRPNSSSAACVSAGAAPAATAVATPGPPACAVRVRGSRGDPGLCLQDINGDPPAAGFINQPRSLRQRLWPHHEGAAWQGAGYIYIPIMEKNIFSPCNGSSQQIIFCLSVCLSVRPPSFLLFIHPRSWIWKH